MLQSLPKTRDRAVARTRLAQALEINEAQEPILESYLTEFVRLGLASYKSGKYWRRASQGVLIGTLTGTRSGRAFVIPDDEREREKGDLFINERSLRSAMHGDKVVARITGSGQRGRFGLVEAVLHRANQTVVGRFIKLKTENLVSPFEEKFLYEIAIPPGDTHGAANGDVVNVEITRAPVAGRLPSGRVIEVLGPEDAPGMDLEIIIRKHRLPHVFGQPVIDAAEAIRNSIPEDEIARRLDLRDSLTVTIDGETARDFDDAVSLEPLPGGKYRLGVHIADVSYYVREGSALDEEAFRRVTSVYFPERAIPMLPERLSNNICSLNPAVDRLTMSAIMDLNSKGEVIYYRLLPTVIRSRERMTYTAVNDIVNDPDGDAGKKYSHVREMLMAMHSLALVLIGRREERGAIDFDLPEALLTFDDEGQMCGVVRSERNIAHRLIEEFMLLANETVASHLESLAVPAIYRIHEEPDPSKLEEFQEVVESFGHRFSIHGPIPQKGFQILLREIEGLKEERMLSYLMLRSMERARYSPRNEGHFGLAMKTYTHFTSPI
ncbi:MAG: ribonuclease R family protein, partial [Blastocatellia bacterium]